MAVNYPKNSHPMYHCGRHYTVALSEPCHSSIRCEILDALITRKLLEALSPAGVELSLRVIQDEETRRSEMEQLYVDRVQHRSTPWKLQSVAIAMSIQPIVWLPRD
jgi:hypothetical protein